MTTHEYNKTVDEWSDRVFAYVLKLVKDREMAEDFVQDIYEKLWKKVDEVSYEKAKSYLFTSAYHAVIDWSRREKLKRSHAKTELSEVKKDEQDHSKELQVLIDKGLNLLSEQQRQLILLRDYEGYSYDEIGEMTELSEAQVKVYIFRGRKQLKEFITEHWMS
jgi:RNA polymerase sigma-70 factor (ECF subfamily)